MEWPFLKRKVKDLPIPSLKEMVKRTRILVIDDNEDSFPLALLRREGYAIDYWARVDQLGPLEEGNYDIIFLDIQGVAKAYSDQDGLGILEHIKTTNPGQIVVAFSAHSYDLSKNRFFKLADDTLSKPVDVTRCKELIDTLIREKMTPQHYWSAVRTMMNRSGVSEKDISRIERRVTDAVRRRDSAAISESVRGVMDNAEVAVRVVALICKISELFGGG